MEPEDEQLHDSLAPNANMLALGATDDQALDTSRKTKSTKQVVPEIGDKIHLGAFDLGPEIEVEMEYHVAVTHPGPVKELGILTLRESLHEFIPLHPGAHGILYYDYEDLPKYLVRV